MKKKIFKMWEKYNKHLSDKLFLQIYYFRVFGKLINLSNPRTFNEKLQWLKLNDRNPDYTKKVDKYEVRHYIKEKIGDQYLIPLLGVWNSFDEINFDELPNEFVLKCTHDSGTVFICIDKKAFDKKKVKDDINKALSINYFYNSREWPYKNVKPRIIAEKFMVDESCNDLRDYKVMCFNGEPKFTLVCSDRGSDLKMSFMDLNWEIMSFKRKYPIHETKVEKPYNYDEMLRLAKILSKDIPFLRVDFYEVNRKLYFGELTFYPASGFGKFYPEEYDRILGDWIDLSKVNK